MKEKKLSNIEIPYYFTAKLGENSDMTLYGCIDSDKCTSIIESLTFADNIQAYDIEVEKLNLIIESNDHPMFDPKLKSSKIEFEQARKRMIDFINSSVN